MLIDPSLCWHLITSLGNLVITSALLVVCSIWLIASGEWKVALSWCTLFGAAMVLVLATKIAFIGWGVGIESLDFTGISGHASRAALIYPVLLFVAMQKHRWIGAAAGTVLSMLIACSRVIVHAHSCSEALSGFLLGCALSAILLASINRELVLQSRWWLSVCLLLLALFGPADKSTSTDGMVKRLALIISGHDKPITRKIWTHHLK